MGVPDGLELRCSAVIVRKQAVLLIHRTGSGADDWVLPGGTPRQGESMAACAHREVREETGLQVDPTRVAFVLEVLGPDSGPRTVDIVFSAAGPAPSQQPAASGQDSHPTTLAAGSCSHSRILAGRAGDAPAALAYSQGQLKISHAARPPRSAPALTRPSGSCQTGGLAKGLARTVADAADSPCIRDSSGEATMSRVSEDEVLLLWRALRVFRSGKKPRCGPRGQPARSECPLYDRCPRWDRQPDDWLASLEETAGQIERRRSSWPCSRLLELLSPDLTRIGS